MDNENLQHPLHKSIIVATITATVCFLLFGAFLLLLIFVISISIFGLFDNPEKPNAYQDIFYCIVLFIAVIINSYFTTKVTLYMVNYYRLICSKVLLVLLPIFYLLFVKFFEADIFFVSWQIKILHTVTMSLILLTSYYSGYRQVKIIEQSNS